MAMSKKHYVEVARIFKTCLHPDTYNHYRAVREFCTMFKRDNPAFDTAKFMEACGFEADAVWRRHDTE